MAHTLADEFLADLEEEVPKEEYENDKEADLPHTAEDMDDEQEEDEELEEIARMKYKDVKQFTKLLGSEKLSKLLERIHKTPKIREIVGPIEADPEYQLIVDANNVVVEITQETSRIHKFVKEIFSKQFTELDSLVMNSLDYARVVLQIGRETDLNKVDLTGILPSQTILSVKMTATTSKGIPLDDDEWQRVYVACNMMTELEDARRVIVEYVESRMNLVAPNLTAILGSSLAAKMMTAAGGLTALSKIPSCNIQMLGSNRKNLAGFSSATIRPYSGYIYQTDIVSKAASALKTKACRLLAGKVILAARCDCFHEDIHGGIGHKFREEVEKKLEKLQEPPPAKDPKPLPAPDDKPKKKRGGKRMRKIKQKFEMTELRKAANRVNFGVVEQEEIGYTGKGLGTIGALQGSGKVRLTGVDKGLLKKVTKKVGGSSGATSGLSSSLAFTPVQGLELTNPAAQAAAAAQKVKEANERYFGNSTFGRPQKQ